MKVCHMTSVHESKDDRIFLKECISLAKAGYDTYLVAYGKSENTKNVKIIGIGNKEHSRVKRFLYGSKRIYQEALKVDADVYHFHDPELLPYARRLKKAGKRVIYDSHEDVPRQIMAKDWIPHYMRKFISYIFEKYEKYIAKHLDCVVTATPHIAKEFEKYGATVEIIYNYPILEDIQGKNQDYLERDNIICYAGGLTEQRGISDIIESVRFCNVDLHLAGQIDEEYSQQLKNIPGSEKTKYLGFLNRKEIEDMYNKSKVGLCILRKTPNHINALAIKLFEYMAAGIPIVCSNFPLWVEIVEKNECGLCVEPQNIHEISTKINYLLENPEMAKAMGDKGKKIVKEMYNWKIEEVKLIRLYKMLLN